MRLFLKRVIRNDGNIMGVLYGRGFACYTLELPDRNNEVNVSCIPAQIYDCYYTSISSFPDGAIVIQNVAGRTDIRIHVGNAAEDIKGCIAVGDTMNSNISVTNSRVAFNRLVDYINKGKFMLFIEDFMPKQEVTDGTSKT